MTARAWWFITVVVGALTFAQWYAAIWTGSDVLGQSGCLTFALTVVCFFVAVWRHTL